MDCKIYFRRAVALLLCCLLAIYTPVLPIAHALDPATIAIAGGQLAGGGLEGAAAASSLAGPVGAIVGVTLGAIGVGTFVSKKAAEQGMSPTEFVVLTIGKYCVAADIAKEQFYKRVLDGCAVAVDGAISLSNDAAQAIQQFGSWLFEAGEVVESPTTDSGSLNLNDYSFPAMTLGALYPLTGNDTRYSYFSILNNDRNAALLPVYMIVCTDGCIALSSNSPDAVKPEFRYYNSSMESPTTMGVVASNSISHYAWAYGTSNGFYRISNPTYPGSMSSFATYFRNHYGDATVDQESYDQVFTGTPEAWAENKDVLNPSADEDTPAAVLNPDVLNPIIEQLAEGTQWQMGIEDYLKALQAAFDQSITGIGDRVADLIDVVTGIKKEIAIPDDATKTADLTKPDVKPIDTPVIQPTEVNPDEAIDGISFELDKVFPFCLPFDVYKMLNLLSADPVAPRYHVHYEGPYNIVIDFTVDLSAWNNVAAICRNMELLLFCIGLAVATRSIFIRA